ncbi:MAG TPA: recombination mediator RecR [Candidatus Goldiibacteriota bacterium]|nr:recombination mediator RecR [Candidatus Goldiibacteriota bacterium]
MYNYPHSLLVLINEISKLPGIGPKLAERIALSLLRKGSASIDRLCQALSSASEIITCSRCFNVSDSKVCTICADDKRDTSILCVVESAEDVINVERTGKFRGYYLVLQGLLNPLENILPSDLKLAELALRIKEEEGIKEILLAVNHTVEGDATALYIAELAKNSGRNLLITRLAKGLPTGSDIKYTDEITLGQAIVERKKM